MRRIILIVYNDIIIFIDIIKIKLRINAVSLMRSIKLGRNSVIFNPTVIRPLDKYSSMTTNQELTLINFNSFGMIDIDGASTYVILKF